MDQDVTFGRDIRPLFSDRDISSMSSRFDLSSYDDVRANAEAIYERLADGTMPCYGAWPADNVERFRTWIDNGFAIGEEGTMTSDLAAGERAPVAPGPDHLQAHSGEVGIEIAPLLDAGSADADLADRIDALLRRTCKLARALTGAEQSALKLWVGEDPTKARKYFSLSEKYAAFSDFRVDPKGIGLHGMAIPPGEVVRLTEDEVLRHPLFLNFGSLLASHPPMRGWLATSVCGEGGHLYGLLQLSDKSGDRDFDALDEENVRELAALIGETLDALRATTSSTS